MRWPALAACFLVASLAACSGDGGDIYDYAAPGAGGAPQPTGGAEAEPGTSTTRDSGSPTLGVDTGSIFANGYTNGAASAGGTGGAVSADPRGIGTGDLTVLVIYDRSASMFDDWEGGAKWAVASRALLDALAGTEEAVTMGTLFFPTDDDCAVLPFTHERHIQFQPGTTFRQRWEAYPASRFPGGETPLGAAFEAADLTVWSAYDQGLIGFGRRFRIVVVTDGVPTCNTNPDRVVELAQNWANLGAEIHVIGLPGSTEGAELLDRLATVGGTGEHSAPETQNEAEDGLTIILR